MKLYIRISSSIDIFKYQERNKTGPFVSSSWLIRILDQELRPRSRPRDETRKRVRGYERQRARTFVSITIVIETRLGIVRGSLLFDHPVLSRGVTINCVGLRLYRPLPTFVTISRN